MCLYPNNFPCRSCRCTLQKVHSQHKLAMPKLEERHGRLRAFTETCLVWSQGDHICVSRARCSVLYLHTNMEKVSALKVSWVIHTSHHMALIVSWHLRAKLCTQVRIKKKKKALSDCSLTKLCSLLSQSDNPTGKGALLTSVTLKLIPQAQREQSYTAVWRNNHTKFHEAAELKHQQQSSVCSFVTVRLNSMPDFRSWEG